MILSRIKKILQNTILVFLGLFIAVLFLEVILRIWIPGINDDLRIWERSPISFYSLKQSYKGPARSVHGEFTVTVKTNALGLRDDHEFSQIKPDNTFRILVLGDSFTFGYGVESEGSYPKQLEVFLRDYVRDRNIEVLNAGFADGWAPDTEYLYLKNRGILFGPDLVILGFFQGNDIIDLSRNKWDKDENQLPLRITQAGTGLVPRIIKERSTLFQFLKWKIHGFIKKALRSAEHIGSSPSDQRLMQPQDLINEHLVSTKLLLRGMQDISKKNNARFAVVIIPAMEAVIKGETRELTRIRRDISEFCMQQQIPVLDLLSPFAKHQEDSKKRLYFQLNAHWTNDGHFLAARDIFNFLLSEKLLERN